MSRHATVAVETLENLLSAYNSERNASARYSAFAVQADKEHLFGIGSLFRAISHSEQVHATIHARLLRKLGSDLDLEAQPVQVRTTRENLSAALRGEQDERDQMYPEFASQARADHCEEAAKCFDSTSDVEEEHALMFAAALDSLEDYGAKSEYYVCMSCGCVSTGKNFKRCMLCGNPRSGFDTIE